MPYSFSLSTSFSTSVPASGTVYRGTKIHVRAVITNNSGGAVDFYDIKPEVLDTGYVAASYSKPTFLQQGSGVGAAPTLGTVRGQTNKTRKHVSDVPGLADTAIVNAGGEIVAFSKAADGTVTAPARTEVADTTVNGMPITTVADGGTISYEYDLVPQFCPQIGHTTGTLTAGVRILCTNDSGKTAVGVTVATTTWTVN